MITFNKVNKSFKQDEVIKDFTLNMPKTGLIGIMGESGSGKSTILNIIAGLTDFSGEIAFFGQKYHELTENDMDSLRASDIGFVFQDFKLFEYETVEDNILLAINITKNESRYLKKRRVHDLLKIVGLENKKKRLIKELSGGEKQRVAIARALVNNPRLILADEPTGNLDSENAKIVMKLLSRVGETSLVLIVSHDLDLLKHYTDTIIWLKNGVIDGKITNISREKQEKLPLLTLESNSKAPTLPNAFVVKHSLHNIRRRKWRSIFLYFSTSISLLGVGLATTIGDIISNNIYRCYSSIIPTNDIFLRNMEVNKDNIITSTSLEEVIEVKNTYPQYFIDEGIYYYNQFDKLFTNTEFKFSSLGIEHYLTNFSIELFNEYINIDDVSSYIFSNDIEALEDNEVILGLTYPTIRDICYQLNIERSEYNLWDYINRYHMKVRTYLSNLDWEYSKDFALEIKGFTITNSNCFIHRSNSWNEYIFEGICGLSITDYFNVNSKNPWDLKKCFYLKTNQNRDRAIKELYYDKQFSNLTLEILNNNYYKSLYNTGLYDSPNRIMFLNIVQHNLIEPSTALNIVKSSTDITDVLYGTNGSYSIYPENFMMGFSRLSFLTNDPILLDDSIDAVSYIKEEESTQIAMNNGVISGHFSKNRTNGFFFNPSYRLVGGNMPLSYDEVVISKGVVNYLGIDKPINSIIYFAYPVKENIMDNNFLYREYEIAELKVVGISDSEAFEINHNRDWTTLFFQSRLGMSVLDLGIKEIALNVKSGSENKLMINLKNQFPNFEVIYPISSVILSVSKICNIITLSLLVFSFSSMVISALLIILCNYLHFLEIRYDVGLVRCLGVSKKQANKFIVCHSLILCFLSFILSTVELLLISLILSKVLSNVFYISSTFIFNPLSLLYMFLVAASIFLVSSFWMRGKVMKLDPLQCLRR